MAQQVFDHRPVPWCDRAACALLHVRGCGAWRSGWRSSQSPTGVLRFAPPPGIRKSDHIPPPQLQLQSSSSVLTRLIPGASTSSKKQTRRCWLNKVTQHSRPCRWATVPTPLPSWTIHAVGGLLFDPQGQQPCLQAGKRGRFGSTQRCQSPQPNLHLPWMLVLPSPHCACIQPCPPPAPACSLPCLCSCFRTRICSWCKHRAPHHQLASANPQSMRRGLP